MEASQPKPAMADAEKKAALTDPFVTTGQQKAVSGTTQKSGGEDDWYKAALAKAQAIAKNISSPLKPGTVLPMRTGNRFC